MYIDLLNKLSTAHDITLEKVYQTQDSLLEFIREVERKLLTLFVVRLNELEKKRKNTLEAIQNIDSIQAEGPTAEEKTGGMATVLAERLASIEKEIAAFQASQYGVFDFVSDIAEQLKATKLIETHTDIGAPNPDLVM